MAMQKRKQPATHGRCPRSPNGRPKPPSAKRSKQMRRLLARHRQQEREQNHYRLMMRTPADDERTSPQ